MSWAFDDVDEVVSTDLLSGMLELREDMAVEVG
jgi:hypothetical protein